MEGVVLSPVEFVALVNQTLEFALSHVYVEGEVSNFRVSKNRWVYFDLKDEQASVKCFGTVYQLPGPLEDGMLLKVQGVPRLHPRFGFSINIQRMQPSGEGSIKKTQQLLQAKLQKEGMFAPERKRPVPYPPQRIGLITSGESAAYADFIKIIDARWRGIEIVHADVQVQGELAVEQLVQAIERFNAQSQPVEVLVVTRGGGSADDLAAFSTEQVTRAVAASRIPTLVAIGHEVDTSLAELSADKAASTPSNAAELLVPNRSDVFSQLIQNKAQLGQALRSIIAARQSEIDNVKGLLAAGVRQIVDDYDQTLQHQKQLLGAFNPQNVLRRGFAAVRRGGVVLRTSSGLNRGDRLDIQLEKGYFIATYEEERD